MASERTLTRETMPQCPRYEGRGCLPGPHMGRCCEETPPAPVGFNVIYRNPGHWDIVTHLSGGRAFRIRGEPGDVRVSDERRHIGADPSWKHFRSVTAAMAWCADELMHEPTTGSPAP